MTSVPIVDSPGLRHDNIIVTMLVETKSIETVRVETLSMRCEKSTEASVDNEYKMQNQINTKYPWKQEDKQHKTGCH